MTADLNLTGVQQVELHSVNEALRNMWSATFDGKNVQESPPVIRACALNLVVYIANTEKLPEVMEAIDQVSEFNPNRAIVLVTDKDRKGADLTTYIKSVCRVPDARGKKLCCEQIVVVGGREANTVIHSALHPLLVPDLPVYLWWVYRPDFEEHLFRRLTQTVDRLIVDSDVFDQEDFDRLVDFVSRGSEDLAVSDLNWGRLTRWRQLLAQFYDSAAYRSHLNRLSRVEMDYLSDGSFPVRPLLLLGWLASRLGWTPQREIEQTGQRYDAEFKSAGETVSVSFNVMPRRGEGAAISEVRLTSISGATFLANRKSEGDFAETTVTLPRAASVTSVAKMTTIRLEEILHRELEVLDRDQIYEEALQIASQLT